MTRRRILRDPGSDEAYEAAEHEFPTAMGTPSPTGLSQPEYKKLNNEHLTEAAAASSRAHSPPYRSAQELVYAQTLEGAHKQFFHEAEYSDMLEGYLQEFIALADRVRLVTERPMTPGKG